MTQDFINTKYIIEFCLAAVSSLGILSLLFLSRPLKESRHPEDRMFRRLCWTLLIYVLTYVLQYWQRIYKPLPYYSIFAHLALYLSDFVMLFLCMQWLIFVDLAVNRSPEGARRRYRFVWVPLLVMVLLLAVGYALLLNVHAGTLETGSVPVLADKQYMTWSWIYYYVVLFIFIAYLLSAYRIVRFYHSERKEPLFLRLDVFIIPWIIAFIVQNIPGFYLVIDVPCAAISLFLTYFSMRNRYRYMDYDTEMYNEDFLSYFENYAEKSGLTGGCAMSFTTSWDPKKFADNLMQYKPERSLSIRMKDGRFIIIASMNKRSAVKCFMDLIIETAKNADSDAEIKTENWFREKDESCHGFAERVLYA